jgi:hypothetical protein
MTEAQATKYEHSTVTDTGIKIIEHEGMLVNRDPCNCSEPAHAVKLISAQLMTTTTTMMMMMMTMMIIIIIIIKI